MSPLPLPLDTHITIIPHKHRPLANIIAVCLGLGILASGLTISAVTLVNAYKARMTREQMVELMLQKARRHANEPEKVQGYLRVCIDAAPPRMKAMAGNAMGEFYLSQAKVHPQPNAKIAAQYFLAASDLNPDPYLKQKLVLNLSETYRLLDDREGAMRTAHMSLTLVSNLYDKVVGLSSVMDTCLEIGDWNYMDSLMKEGQPHFEAAGRQTEFSLIGVSVNEKLLQGGAWLRDYAAAHSNQPTGVAREALLQENLNACSNMVAHGNAFARQEALFRLARLYSREERFSEARDAIQQFLATEPSTHMSEALLILARVATAAGEPETAAQMITTCIRRYPTDEEVVAQTRIISRQLQAGTQTNRALKVVQEFCSHQTALTPYADLVFFGAELADSVRKYDVAVSFLDSIIRENADPGHVAEAYMRQSDLCMKQGNPAGAEGFILKFLALDTEFNRDEAFYRLFAIRVAAGMPVSELVGIASKAIEMSPQDPRALDVLMTIAQKLEDLGLYRMADREYNRVAILNYVSTDTPMAGRVGDTIGRAMVGRARCLIYSGESIKADHMLRDLCRGHDTGPVRAEAAYLWATIAVDHGQLKEGLRRLTMASRAHMSTDLVARVDFEKKLIQVAQEENPILFIDAVFQRIDGMPLRERGRLVRRTYEVLFDRMEERGLADSMRLVLDHAVNGAYAKDVPTKSFAVRLAQQLITEKGMTAYVDFMRDYAEVMKSTDQAASMEVEGLLNEWKAYNENEDKVDAFL